MLKILLTRGDQKSGVWLSLPATTDELHQANAALDHIHGAETNTEMRIAEVESPIPNLRQFLMSNGMGGIKNMKELNYLVQRVNDFTEYEADMYSGALEIEAINDLKDMINLTYSLEDYILYSGVSLTDELGKYLVENSIVQIPENIIQYIDFEKVGHQYELDNGGTYTRGGYVLKVNENDMRQVYDGQTFPDSTADQECIFRLKVCPSYLPEAQDKQFILKLPVSQTSLELMLKKFGVSDFGDCDVQSCDCHIKRLSNTLNIEGDIYGLNELANRIKDMLNDRESIVKFLAVLEEERPGELSEALDIARDLDRYEFLPRNIKTPVDYACHVLFDSGRYTVDNEVRDFVDLERYGTYKMEEDGVRKSTFGMLRKIDEPFKEQKPGFTQQMGGM